MNNLLLARAAVVVLAVATLPSLQARASAPAQGGEYYYNAGRRVAVRRSASRLALKPGPAATAADALAVVVAGHGARAARDVKAAGLVEVTVADAKSPASDLEEAADRLGGDLLPVFVEPGPERDASTLFIADEILVQFAPGVSREQTDALAAVHGVEVVEPLAYAPGGFRLRVVDGGLERNALTVANAYYESGLCLFAHPNFVASRRLAFVPNDPQYANQWHLNNSGQGSGTAGADVKAQAAWDTTQGSTSITVAVADTGIDWHHEDLEVTVDGVAKIVSPRDVVHGDNDPFPQSNDADGSHGTAASGVAVAASNNGLDTAGIAPKARLMPIQLYAESTFTPNSTEADAFTWAADHGADVMSNSWGPDNSDTPLPDATRAAIDHATSTGRGGKGMVIFFAAGNNNFDTIHNNYANYSGVVAVAASTNRDRKSSYSNFGAAISVAAPSSGGTLSITTTDATGSLGYSSGNYTTGFGGTSSACPLAAGTAALVLSANPNLTWRQVKRVLEQSADKIDTAGGAYDALGHSSKYGFGRINASRAVQLAAAGGPDSAGLFEPTASTFFLRQSNSPGAAEITAPFGPAPSTWKPVVGDWDGNGTDTLGLYDPASGFFFLKNTNGAGPADLQFQFGVGGQGFLPVAGDWNGDGTVTVGLYNPANGAFLLRNANAPGPADVQLAFGPGGQGWVPVDGDWDGDGDDTVGAYSPANGFFFLKNANTSGPADVQFQFGPGGSSWKPLSGDWDGDGRDSAGLYDPTAGFFYVRNAQAGGPADWSYSFGPGGWTPLAGNWDGQ
jgi:subtilisin family serine protease